MEGKEIDPASGRDKFYLQKMVQIRIIPSLRVSRSNDNVHFYPSKKVKAKSKKRSSFLYGNFSHIQTIIKKC